MNGSASNSSAKTSLFFKWVANAGLLAMTAIIAWQVFARYVLNASPAWAEQAALLLMIWFVFLAAAAGVREGFHIRISVFADSLPHTFGKVLFILNHLLVALFGLAMIVWGAELTVKTWSHVIPTLNISRGYAYIPIPLSGVLITFFSIEHIVAYLRGVKVKVLWN